VPEGGTNALAIQGSKEILSNVDREQYDLICCAVGTGGTLSGLIESSAESQQLLGFSALKGTFLSEQIRGSTQKTNWNITDDYCFGEYAKSSPRLLNFMASFEERYQIPLEPIYTAKMFYGLFDLIEQQAFTQGIRILALHTGGLQGRLSAK